MCDRVYSDIAIIFREFNAVLLPKLRLNFSFTKRLKSGLSEIVALMPLALVRFKFFLDYLNLF